MGNAINILHISDLHFTRKADAYNQGIILNALKEDLKRLCDGPLKPDVIAFTGDLVRAGDEDDIFLHLYDEVIAELAKIARCSDRRIILCPGNHDAHREA